MALVDNAVLSVGTGHFYTAPYIVGGPTAPPANKTALLAPPSPYAEIGHTSLEDILSISSEGGDATVLGTLQNKALRTAYSARTESLAITLQQFDSAALKLYYGSNTAEIATGSNFVGVSSNPTPSTVTFLAVFQDGQSVFAFYAPKAEIYRGDDLAVSDTESLVGLPLNIKPLIHGSNTWAYAVTPLV